MAMDDLNIIDRFTETFSRYIDFGFGLLAGDVAFLTTILVAIDITLAGLFWALPGEDNVVGAADPQGAVRRLLRAAAQQLQERSPTSSSSRSPGSA